MNILLTGGCVLTAKGFEKMDISIDKDRIFAISSEFNNIKFKKVIHCDNFFVVPSFVDVHVHLREPGFSYKETIKSGTQAALKGGYSTICTMPNLKPAPESMERLNVQLDIIKKDAEVKVIPYGTITKDGNQLSDMEEMSQKVIAFSDDGRGVQSNKIMKEAMIKAKSLGKLIVAHCEDETYNTYEPESEWKQVERDIELVKETGCPYHVCHISTKETVDLIRQAKKEGVDITCETAPHYLIFDNENLPDEGRFKMNPPIRGKKDKDALLEGIKDGTIDMIATDHAPHSEEEKSKGFKDSLFGIIGMETAFPVLYTELVEKNIITLEKLIELMSINPRKRFGIEGGLIKKGEIGDLTILNLNKEFIINPDNFASKGRSTPFEKMKVKGEVVGILIDGELK